MPEKDDSEEEQIEVEHDPSVVPTKIVLLEMKAELEDARSVRNILKDIQTLLVKELDQTIDAADKKRGDFSEPLEAAYSALRDAYMKVGALHVDGVATTTPSTAGVDITTHNVAGVDIPHLTLQTDEKGPKTSYGFDDTSVTLDLAVKRTRALLILIVSAAETEAAIYRLSEKLEKVQLTLNAVTYVLIPQYKADIKYVEETLTESERDERVMQKHLKSILTRKAVTDALRKKPVVETGAKPLVKTPVKG